MRLKTYQAKTMQAVMQLIKAELGDDAVIVTTRTLDNGEVRVTAAQDDDVQEPLETFDDTQADFDTGVFFHGIRDYDHIPEHNPSVQQSDNVMRALMRHSIPAALHDKILTAMENTSVDDARQGLIAALQSVFKFDSLPVTKYERPMMLVGQPGAGKTMTIAKLATRAVMHGLKPAVITADTTRAGAVEQLAAFTKVLGLELIKVNSPEQLKQALYDHANADQILIDCPGLNAFDADDMKELYAYTKSAPMDLVLAMPGGMDTDEASDIARAFAVLGAKWIIPTRLDMARRVGGVLSAADQGGLAFAAAGTGAQVADGLSVMDAAMLADILLPKAERGVS